MQRIAETNSEHPAHLTQNWHTDVRPAFSDHAPRAVIPFSRVEKVRDALELWLAGFSSENSKRAYRKEIGTFAAFAGRDDVSEAVAAFLALDDGAAHASADAWRADKIARNLSPASINRSMAALNSLVSSSRRHGITTLRLEAKGMKSRSYRDTEGPGGSGVQALIAAARADDDPMKG